MSITQAITAAIVFCLLHIGMHVHAADIESGSPLDCSNPRTTLMKRVCVDEEFIEKDKKLRSNYLAMMSSGIGEEAKKDLKNSQDQWRHTLKKCTNRKCMNSEYTKRINEICDYPVINGIYPVCELER